MEAAECESDLYETLIFHDFHQLKYCSILINHNVQVLLPLIMAQQPPTIVYKWYLLTRYDTSLLMSGRGVCLMLV